nr:hypothetical protein [Tanacetum cinerariifolium]
LFAKNKTDFVDGTLKKPETSSSEYKSWMRCDAMIKGWLTTAMEKGIRDSVKYANTSSEIWTQILATKPIPTLGTAYHMVAEDESSRTKLYRNPLHSRHSRGPGKKDDKAKSKAAYVETGTTPIPGLNEGQYQEFVKFFSRSSNDVEAKPEANMAGNKDDGHRTRSLTGSGKCQRGLYLMDMFEKGRRAMMTTTDTWNKRLGHASRDKVSIVSFLKNNSSKLSNVFCDSCAKAKHVRNPFPKGSLDCNKDEPTKVHDDFKSTNFFLDSGEQNCFDGPPQNPSSTTTEDIRSEEENVAQNENDLFTNNSPVLGPEIKEDHAISHKEPKPRIAKLVTVRTLLVVATKKGWIIHQLDVNNAFLHGDLDEEVYMKTPKGFAKEGETRDSGTLGCRPSAFTFEQGTKLDKGEGARVDATQYRRLVGRLLYLQATRPDVTYAVNVLSQFVSDPRQNHLEAVKRVLRYLKGTSEQRILLPREGPTTLTAYCDSDWLGFPFTRRSRTGYLLLFSGGPISWKTKKQ